MPVASTDAATVVFNSFPERICRSGTLALAEAGLARMGEDLRVLDPRAHVEDQQRREDPEEHQHPPRGRLGEQLERDEVRADRERPADRPRALDDPQRAAARLAAHQLGDQHRADAPLGAEPDPLEDPEAHQHLVAGRQA
jgi:hypothetical protein